ncbi:MAG: TonB family protein [Kiritimatiellae bacterium]|nr:TonB family protein [Kiritimatiellia bacterium]
MSLTFVATRKADPEPIQKLEEIEITEPEVDIPKPDIDIPEPDIDVARLEIAIPDLEVDIPKPEINIAEEPSPAPIDPIKLPDIASSILLPPPKQPPAKPESNPPPETRLQTEQVPAPQVMDIDLNEKGEIDNDADMLKKGAEVFSAGVTEIKPRYPLGSRLRGEEGKVVLKVVIDMDGRASDVGVYASSGFSALDRAAVAAVRRARFITSGGGDRGGTVLLTFEFKLTD